MNYFNLEVQDFKETNFTYSINGNSYNSKTFILPFGINENRLSFLYRNSVFDDSEIKIKIDKTVFIDFSRLEGVKIAKLYEDDYEYFFKTHCLDFKTDEEEVWSFVLLLFSCQEGKQCISYLDSVDQSRSLTKLLKHYLKYCQN